MRYNKKNWNVGESFQKELGSEPVLAEVNLEFRKHLMRIGI